MVRPASPTRPWRSPRTAASWWPGTTTVATTATATASSPRCSRRTWCSGTASSSRQQRRSDAVDEHEGQVVGRRLTGPGTCPLEDEVHEAFRGQAGPGRHRRFHALHAEELPGEVRGVDQAVRVEQEAV